MPMTPQELRQNLCGAVIAAVTPMHEDFSVDLDGMRSNVERAVADGVVNGKGAFLIAGGGGEIPFLTADERVAVVEAAVEGSAGRVPIVAGVQDEAVSKSVEIARRFEDVGADGLQLAPPCMYGEHPLDDFERFYEGVCSQTSIGALCYNTWWTASGMTPDLVLKLAKIDNVAGVKWSSPNNWEYLQGYRKCADALPMIDNWNHHVMAHMMGARGFISGVGDFEAAHDVELWEMLEAKRYEEVQAKVERLSYAIYEFRVRLGKSTGGEASAKKAMAALVGRAGGPPRAPTRPLTEGEVAELREIMVAAGVPDVR